MNIQLTAQIEARRTSIMHTQDTSGSQTNGRIWSRLSLDAALCIAGGLALLAMAMAPAPAQGQETSQAQWSQAVNFAETPAVRDILSAPLTPEEIANFEERYEAREQNEMNTVDLTAAYSIANVLPFVDPAINNYKHPYPDVVTPPI